MKINTATFILVLSFFLLCSWRTADACSMYKVTIGQHTMVGCNEDAWRLTSNIWFEIAKKENEYGAAFTGSRVVRPNRFAPQSGMNEVGLVFSRLVAYHPKKNTPQEGKKKIHDEVQYLTDILHKCKTVQEVKRYITLYDHSKFIHDVFIYIDKSGDYLIVEPYQFITGSDSSYVLANFCPSLTNKENARIQNRFKNGEDYLKNYGLDTSLNFCLAMSDTMHVSRNRNGDGTLLSSIWDTQRGLINLCFYHKYDSTIQFDLAKELNKGDHTICIPKLFPKNTAFERLANYKTPFNVPALRFSLVFIAGFLLFLSFICTISYFRKKNLDKFNLIKLAFAGINLLLIPYLFILATNINIYYFDAPYQHYSSNIISLSSYTPFVLLLLIIPLAFYTIRYTRVNNPRLWTKAFLIFNSFLYFILIIGFGYWGFFSVFS